MESFLAWSHYIAEERKSTFTSKLLKLFSATLGQSWILLFCFFAFFVFCFLSWAGKSHCQQHGWHAKPSLPLTSHPGPTVQDHYCCQLYRSYLSYTLRGRSKRGRNTVRNNYLVSKTTAKREWRKERDNEGVSEWVSGWVSNEQEIIFDSSLFYIV